MASSTITLFCRVEALYSVSAHSVIIRPDQVKLGLPRSGPGWDRSPSTETPIALLEFKLAQNNSEQICASSDTVSELVRPVEAKLDLCRSQKRPDRGNPRSNV